MAKASSNYVCQSCGASFARWMGKCEACGAWNSIVEEAAADTLPKGLSRGKGKKVEFVALDGKAPEAMRRPTGIAEFDRVTGGGLVRGSAILIGGDPGIGKSTILLQVVNAVAKGERPLRSAYISGEEAVEQVQLRAKRLGLQSHAVEIATATNVRDIIASLDRTDPPDLVVIDSIQTMYLDNLDSAPGTVAQVRSCSAELIRLAKSRGFVVVLDKNNKVISAPGGTEPVYEGGVLKPLSQGAEKIFHHGHDVCPDDEGNLYVCQWNAGKTYPVKLVKA